MKRSFKFVFFLFSVCFTQFCYASFTSFKTIESLYSDAQNQNSSELYESKSIENSKPKVVNSNSSDIKNPKKITTITSAFTFNFTDGLCSSTPVQFTSNITPADPVSIKWNFGDGTTLEDVANPSHTFVVTNGMPTQSFDVKLITVNMLTLVSDSTIRKVTVVLAPDAHINGTGYVGFLNGMPTFQINTNSPQVFTFTNISSTIGTNKKYTINWGDGSPNFTASSWTSLLHTYPIGTWSGTYTIEGANGCNTIQPFVVFVGLKPAVILGSPGSIDPCNAGTLTFPILGTRNNPLGTIYTVSFNDGSTPQIFNHPPPDFVKHTFEKSSCGVTSIVNLKSYEDAYYAKILAENISGKSESYQVPLHISTPLVVDFSLSKDTTCINTSICAVNESVGGDIVTTTAPCEHPKSIWSISPSTGWTLKSGTLGDDKGSDKAIDWIPGSDEICPIFTKSGSYKITYKGGNSCGFFTKDRDVCIEDPLTPTFTLSNSLGCAPLSVNATNTTNISGSCSTPEYTWEVSYTQGFCGTTSAYKFINGTSPISPNAAFEFSNAGTYQIRLTMTNTCGSQSVTNNVEVKVPPTVIINPIPDYCGTAAIMPTATANSCAPLTVPLKYFWEFPGGLPSTSNLETPGPINYAATGTYTVKLYVDNGCGLSPQATTTFKVNTLPQLTNTDLSQSICSGFPTNPVTFLSDIPGATFSWTAKSSTGVTGFIASGSGNSLPSQVINTTNPFPGTVTYSITPTIGTCSGTTVDYIVNVIPQPVLISQPNGSEVCQFGIPDLLSVGYIGSVDAYRWYRNSVDDVKTGSVIGGAITASYQPDASVVGTTYYYCVLTIPGTCTTIVSKTAKVVVTAIPTIATQPKLTQTICVGGTIPTPLNVTYTGGAGTASYQWYINTTYTNSGGTAIPAAANASTYTPPAYTATGTYYYYVVLTFSGSGCGSITSDPAEIKVVDNPTIASHPQTYQKVCQGSTPTTLSVAATGGIGIYNYQWFSNVANKTTSGTLLTGETGQTFKPSSTSAGTLYYYCVVTQPNGPNCVVVSNTAEVEVVLLPTANPLASATYCNGDIPAQLTIVGNNVPSGASLSYKWFSNTVNSYAGATPIGLPSSDTFNPPATIGTRYYYCEVTVTPGVCTTFYSNIAQIVVNDFPVISNKSAQICSGEVFTVSPTNALPDFVPTGTTYTWTLPTQSPANSVNGATAQPSPVSSISQQLFNKIGSASIVTYTVTPWMGSCDGAPFNVEVTIRPLITINTTQTDITCHGANNGALSTLISGGSPGFNIYWSGPNGFNATNLYNLNNLLPGKYDLTVTDVLNCTETRSYTITEPAEFLITNPVKKDITCFGAGNGEIDITVVGGTTPYTITWTKDGNPFPNSTEHLKSLTKGVYVVTVNDAHGCAPQTTSFIIDEPAVLDVTSVVTQNFACGGASTGNIDLTVTGGTTPYSYIWSNFQTTQDLVNTAPGNYSVTVTDKNGCTQILNFTIINPSPLNINVLRTNEFNCTSQVSFKRSVAQITGGFPPYILTWTRGVVTGANGEVMETDLDGEVTLYVEDSKGCKSEYKYDVTIPKPGFMPVLVDCRRFLWQFNAVDPNVAGENYTYLWEFGDGQTSTSKSIQHAYSTAGDYTIKLTISSAACPVVEYQKTITIEPLARLSLGNNIDLCLGDTVVQKVIGGKFLKLWSDKTTADSMVITQKGDYSVICESPMGCLDTLNFTVATELFNYKIYTDQEDLTLDGKALTMWADDIPSSIYSWDFGDGAFGNGNPVTHAYNIVKDGSIELKLKVTNPHGCTETATKRIWVVNNSLVNSFTPNGDGINDRFMPGWHLKIYNRNGILVYEGVDGWNGKYDGKYVSKDTYYYVMDYITASGAQYKDGYVMVIR